MPQFRAGAGEYGRRVYVTVTRIGAVLALTLLIAACVCAPPTARAASGSADVLHRAQDILFRMLQAQENLTSFQATAAARVYIGGRNVLTTSVGLAIERPNRVAVRWLGMTIEPRHGLIFIDPEVFVSKDYVLSVLSAPSESSDDASERSERWVISAVSSGLGEPQLSWTLYVDPDTWLIRRAQVAVGNSAASAGETVVIEADYRQAGYRRWEPVRLSAQGRMVLEEFLPGFLVDIVAGHSGRGAGDALGNSAPRVQLDFGAVRPGTSPKGHRK
jgi:outer membrane lipoprotein-sorting protein